MLHGHNTFGGYALVAVAVALSGCTSLFQGKPYDFPEPGEPSATVRLKSERGNTLEAITFNEKGCYAGYTPLSDNGAFIEESVAVNKELIVTHRNIVGGTSCQISFSFTPQAGATYTVKSGHWRESKPGLLPMFSYDQYHCGVATVKKVGTEESVQPIQQLRIKTRFARLTFVK